MEETTGISRTTLRYYEEAGVISTQRRDGSNYRVYTNSEVGSIIDCALLKTAGYLVAESAAFVTGEARKCADLLDACLRGNERQGAWHEAVREEFRRLRDTYVTGRLMRPRLVRSESLEFYPNQDALGDRVRGDDLHRALFRSAPISSTAELFEEGLEVDGPLMGRWGRAVQRRLLPLLAECIADFPDMSAYDRPGVVSFGEGPQVALSFATPLADSQRLDADHALRDVLHAFMETRHLTPLAPCLLTDYLPVGETLYATLRVPVRAEGAFAKVLVGRLPRG